MRKLVGKLNFAQTSVMGQVGRAALRPPYDMLLRGTGKLDRRARWSLEGRLKLLPVSAPRVVNPQVVQSMTGFTQMRVEHKGDWLRLCCIPGKGEVYGAAQRRS